MKKVGPIRTLISRLGGTNVIKQGSGNFKHIFIVLNLIRML